MIESVSAASSIGVQNNVGISSSTATSATSLTPAVEEDFGTVLSHVVKDAVGVVQGGEDAAIQGIKGIGSPLGVVNAVMSAQQTLHTALAIRDKIVSAYQEISRMTI